MSWRALALCRDTDPALFFPERGERTAVDAKAVCARGPVREECLQAALIEERVHPSEIYGIRAGLTANERRRLLRRSRLTA